jgi:uncharacterized protein
MSRNRDTVASAFEGWRSGTGHVAQIFDEDMTWEIVGRSAASNIYAGKQQFIDAVLQPLANRFRPDAPFRPVRVRGIYEDEAAGAVIIVWDGAGTTIAGTTYTNTYAWIMKLRDAKVVDATAFYDSIAFNELWAITPSDADQ